MKLFKGLIPGGVVLYLFYINGILAAAGFAISLLLLCHEIKHNRSNVKEYNYGYIALFLLSAFLTFYPVFIKPENKVVAFVPAYADGIDNSQINDCPELSSEKSKRYSEIKDEIVMNCSSQDKLDFLRVAKEAILAKVAYISIEFSMASSLKAQDKPRNHCMECIEALIRICPREKRHFDPKSLRALREAWNDYSSDDRLCQSPVR